MNSDSVHYMIHAVLLIAFTHCTSCLDTGRKRKWHSHVVRSFTIAVFSSSHSQGTVTTQLYQTNKHAYTM